MALTPAEYAQIKLTIATVLLGLGQYNVDLADRVFDWVIRLPENAMLRVDLPVQS